MSDPQRASGVVEPVDEGQTLVEYALILSLIAILAILALVFVGGSINAILSSIGQSL